MIQTRNIRYLELFFDSVDGFLDNIQGFIELFYEEDQQNAASLQEIFGSKLSLIKAEHQLFVLTLAQICLKENNEKMAEKALKLDLRMKILNEQIGDLWLNSYGTSVMNKGD